MKKSFYIAVVLSAAGLFGANNAWAEAGCFKVDTGAYGNGIRCYDANGNTIFDDEYAYNGAKCIGNTCSTSKGDYVVTYDSEKNQLSFHRRGIYGWMYADYVESYVYNEDGKGTSKTKIETDRNGSQTATSWYYIEPTAYLNGRYGDYIVRTDANGSVSYGADNILGHNVKFIDGKAYLYDGDYYGKWYDVVVFDGNKLVGRVSCDNASQANCSTEYYDENGRVIAKYDSDDNPTEAYDYTDDGGKIVYNDQCAIVARYDAAGNDLAIPYDPGVSLSGDRHTIYTLPEAAAIIKNSENNSLILYFK